MFVIPTYPKERLLEPLKGLEKAYIEHAGTVCLDSHSALADVSGTGSQPGELRSLTRHKTHDTHQSSYQGTGCAIDTLLWVSYHSNNRS